MYDAILSETITITGANGDPIEAYQARSLDSAPRGGVLVIHHMPGYDDDARNITRRFAARGYNAICPNLYSRFGTQLSAEEGAAASRQAGGKDDTEFLGDIDGAIAALRSLSNANGKVGVIGFCSGGRQAILAATSAPIDAAVDCYGAMVVGDPVPGVPMTPIPEKLPDVHCPVLGLFGADDKNPSPEHVAELTRLLAQHGKEFEPHTFEGAGHSFLQADRAASRPEAAAKAWPLIDEFYARHLA